MNSRVLLVAVVLSVALLAPAIPSYAQTTWFVDDDAPNDPGPGDPYLSDPDEDGTADHPYDMIQKAIDVSSDGDTILVRPGLYIENIDYMGNLITIRSDIDGDLTTYDISPETTFIDGGTIGPVVTLQRGETRDAVLDGFTISNGSGNGILCDESAITVTNCDIVRNSGYGLYAYSHGMELELANSTISDNSVGGIFVEGANLLIDNCTIQSDGGVGVTCWSDSSSEIVDSTISESIAGISCDVYISLTMVNCVLDGNDSGIGAVRDRNTSRRSMVTMTNCLFSGNGRGINTDNIDMMVSDCEFKENGRGIHFERGYIEINHSIISNNNGMGLYFWDDGGAILRNCIISDNAGDGINGEEYFDLTIDNCTISGNSGYGLSCYIVSSATITSSIFYGDSTPDQAEIVFGGGSTITASYSDIQMENSEDAWPGLENINADPLFIAGPEGCYYLSHRAAGQQVDSPCIDSGDPGTSSPGGTTRIDHVDDSGIVDMGYHHGSGLFVPCPATIVADLTCLPSAGTVPFDVAVEVMVMNNDTSSSRRFAGTVELDLAGGQHYSNYRRGYTNIGPGSIEFFSWVQTLAFQSVVGINTATLTVEDVTPPPYNQPPYPPAGDTETAGCTVTGIAP